MALLESARNGAGEARTGALAAIAFGWFLTLGLRFVLPAILPQVKAEFGIDNATAGLAITVVWAGYAVMQFPAGVLVDRLGERTLLSLSLVLAGGSLSVVGGAPVFSVFLAAAGLFGLGTGLFGTSRGVALSKLFSPNPGSAFGVTLAAGSIGSAALPFLASVLTEEIGWRLAVGLSVPLFLVTAAGTWQVMPANSSRSNSGERDGNDAESELSRAHALGALRAALTDPTILVAIVGLTLMLFTFQGLTAFLPTYLVQEKGLSSQLAGALFAVLFVAGAGFQLAGGGAADRFGTRGVLLAVAVVGVFTLAALPFLGGVLPLVGLLVVMASRLAVAPVANAYVLATLPDEAMGTVWGLLRTGLFLLSSLGSVVVGVLSDYGLFDEAFFLLAGLTAVAAATFAFLPTRPSGSAL